MAGSSNLHPAPDLQLNVAGPLISSVRKSLISMIYDRESADADVLMVVIPALTYASVLSANESSGYTGTFDVFTIINRGIGFVAWFVFGSATI